MRIAIAIVVMVAMWAVAKKKGFNPFLWVLAAGIPGFIVLLCMPSARLAEEDDLRLRRKSTADLVGLVLSAVGIVLILGIVAMVQSSDADPIHLLDHVYLGIELILVAAVFRLFPSSRSPWKLVLRIAYGASLTISLIWTARQLDAPLDFLPFAVLRTFSMVTSFACALSLLVLSTRHRLAETSSANQTMEGTK